MIIIDKMQQNRKRRLCIDRNETTDHRSERSKLEQKSIRRDMTEWAR